MREDPYATQWLCGIDPYRAKRRKPQADAIDREIDKILDEARFKAAVVAAKVEIIDDLRRLLEAHNG
jgi:hypothetical protein